MGIQVPLACEQDLAESAQRQPAAVVNDAATTVVWREGRRGIEVFCTQRAHDLKFLGGAIVFPGGRVDTEDLCFPADLVGTAPHERNILFHEDARSAAALPVAAARECLEEAAIIPVCAAPVPHPRVLELRALVASGLPFSKVLADAGVHLDLASLVPFARWVTPVGAPRRFDARFYLLRLPDDQMGEADQQEAIDGFWTRPGDIIDRFVSGACDMAPPTVRTLELLSDLSDISVISVLSAQQSLLPIIPELVTLDGNVYLALPGDQNHSEPEPRVGGAMRFVTQNGRFVSDKA